MASELGVSEDEIRSMADEESALWSEHTWGLLRATDDLIARHTVGDETWKKLRRRLSTIMLLKFACSLAITSWHPA